MGHRLYGVASEITSENRISIDLNSSPIFHPVFSPKTHSLLAIESVERQETMTRKVSHSGIIACSTTKSKINNLLSNKNLAKERYDTIIALRDISWCGIQYIEHVTSSCFNNIFTDGLANNKEKVRDNKIEQSKCDFINVKGFYPVSDILIRFLSVFSAKIFQFIYPSLY